MSKYDREPRRTLLLTQLPETDRQTFAFFLNNLEINHGCGGRLCKICCESSPKYQTSMPFSDIQAVHQIKAKFLPKKTLRHFIRGDNLYYKYKNKSYLDVLIDAYERGLNIDAMTHGFLATETYPHKVATSIVNWATARRLTDVFSVSIDPYGYLGISQKEHELGVQTTLATLGPIIKNVFAFYNPFDETYGQGSTQEWAVRIVDPALVNKIQYFSLYNLGRMKSVSPAAPDYGPQDVSDNLAGYFVYVDGRVEFAKENYTTPYKIGNIYSFLPNPLPNPIPRA